MQSPTERERFLSKLDEHFDMKHYTILGEKIGMPPRFKSVLKRIITPLEAEILLAIEHPATCKEIANTVSYDTNTIEDILELLVKKGYASKRNDTYKSKGFFSIIDVLLGEGKYHHLEPPEIDALREYYLKKRHEISLKLIKEKKIPVSSKVIPVKQSFKGVQHILPTEEALEIIQNAHTFALAPCTCRTAFNRCDNPKETCILLDDVASNLLERGVARKITLEKAEKVLSEADEHNLVHLTIYNPAGVYAICSCCECCCHDLQAIKKYGKPDIIAKSDYIALVEPTCIHCGICVERCIFNARKMENGKMLYNPEKCHGCGLCISTCPVQATRLIPRH
jgi:ferredoxin/DNA-binding MarR family transcriptional regulator